VVSDRLRRGVTGSSLDFVRHGSRVAMVLAEYDQIMASDDLKLDLDAELLDVLGRLVAALRAPGTA
jgi:hypothetical protein